MSDRNPRILISNTIEDFANQGARLFFKLIKDTLLKGSTFTVALSGGNTPRPIYELLSREPYRAEIDWRKVHVFWSDEHFVPLTDPSSTYRMSQDALLRHVPIPLENVHPMPFDKDVHEAARQYRDTIVKFFGSSDPKMDLVLLGMGADGHIASLFPGTQDLLNSGDDLIIAIENSPKPPPARVSFSHRMINLAANIMFLVTGSDKAPVLHAVLEGPNDVMKLPAQGVQPLTGQIYWLTDKSAAQLLSPQ